jgi:fatty acid desaturase
MQLHYQCDRTNVIRALSAPLIFFYPYIFGFPEGYELFTALVLWGILNDINHVLHLHIHHPFSKNKYINLLFDICMGVTTGMVTSNWKIQHKYGHHQLGLSDSGKKNKWDLAKDWEIKKFTILGALSYSIRTSAPIFYLPLIEAFKKGGLQNIKTPLNYRYAFIEQSLFIVFVLILLIIEPVITLAYLIPWYLLVYFVTRYIDYLNHFARGNGKFDSSNNSMNYWYNWMGHNFGYHSAHHYRPSAHWSLLPQIHEEIKHHLTEDQLKPYSWSGFSMPYHFYLCLKGRI